MPEFDTLFTASPEWTWWVILYFFFGGLAGGTYFLGTIIGMFGRVDDRPLSRVAHYIAFPALLVCAPLLIVDLNRPERFWHMILQDHSLWPSFKYWSPMSVGAWALLIFGGFTFISFVGALWESGRIRWTPPRVCCTDIFRFGFSFLGTLAGFFLASYTGVLLSVTNRVIWADTNLIGLLFIASAASTSAALILVLAPRSRAVTASSLQWLRRMDRWTMYLEVVALIALVVSLGAVAQLWLNQWGVLLVVGVLIVGLLIPLLLHGRPRILGGLTFPVAAVFALVGGFVMRAVVVLSAQSF